MAHIIRPNNENPKREKFNSTHRAMEQPAVKINYNKGKIAEERKKRLEVAEKKPDQEYLELFETVKSLVETRDYWELVPSEVLTKAYAYTVFEMQKRGMPLPKLPEKESDMYAGGTKELPVVPDLDLEAVGKEIEKIAKNLADDKEKA